MTFIDKRGMLNHLVATDNPEKFYSYENILKNSKKLDPWNTFIIKVYLEDGTDLIEYVSASKKLFRDKNMFELTKKYNPELLI